MSPNLNPYAPPAAPVQATETCPKCGSNDVHTPAFTWWGGAVGPRMLSHRVCRACKFGFNAKTGRSNTGAIVLYQGVAIVVTVLALGTLWAWKVRPLAGKGTTLAFVHGCAGACVKRGTSPEDCQRVCECVAADLQREGDAHFRQVLSETQRTGAASREMTDAAERCRKK